MEIQTQSSWPEHRRGEYNDSERQAKRQKVKLACQECRDRKIRCDGARPICHSCSRKNLAPDRCIYSVAETEPADSYVRALEKRVQELESTQGQNPGDSSFFRSRDLSDPRPERRPSDLPGVEQTPGLATTRVSGGLLSPHGTLSATRDPHPISQEKGATAPRQRTPQRPRNHTRSTSAPRQSTIMPPGHVDAEDIADSQAKNVLNGAHPGCASDGSPAFLGTSSAVGFMAEVYETFRGGKDGATQDSQRVFSSPEDTLASPWFGHLENEDDGSSLTMSTKFIIPPRRVADRLLHSYWNGAHPLQPFIFRCTFMKHYQSLWSNDQSTCVDVDTRFGSDRTSQSEQIFHCMLNLVFALGARFSAKSRKPQDGIVSDKTERIFFNRASELLTLDLMDHGSLKLVQTLLLMAQYLQTVNLSNRCWVVVGMAIRISQGLALHLNIAGESQAQREERRRSWYFGILLDRVQSMTFGRPLMLRSAELGPLPQMIDEEFLVTDQTLPEGSQPTETPPKSAYFISVLKLSNITADILGSFYSGSSRSPTETQPIYDYNTLLTIDAELTSWRDGLPSFLRYDRLLDPADCGELFFRHANLLHHRFLHSRILLFRRVVVQLAAKSFVQGPVVPATTLHETLTLGFVEICTSAAQELLEVIHPHIGTLIVPPAWYTVFLIYTAGTVLAVVLLTPYFQRPLTLDQKNNLQQSWNLSINCLEQYQNLGIPFASTCLLNLRKMHRNDEQGIRDDRKGAHNEMPSEAVKARSSFSNLAENASTRMGQEPLMSDEQIPDWAPEGGYTDILMPNSWWPDGNMDWLINVANSNQDYL